MKNLKDNWLDRQRNGTRLAWTSLEGNFPSSPNNREESLHRLNTLVRRLRRTDMLDEFYAAIREQLEEGVVERAPAEVTGREFYDNVASL